MIKIMSYTKKGGVGKTVHTNNIAGCLTRKYKKKVLVLDLDPQCNTTSLLMENCYEPFSEYTLVDYLKSNDIALADGMLHRMSFPIQLRPGKPMELQDTELYLIPSTPEIEVISLGTEEYYVLKKLLEVYEDDFDYCMIDCPANMSDLTFNAMACADYVLVPCEAEKDSVNGYYMTLNEYNNIIKQSGINSNIQILGVLLSNVSKSRGLERFIKESLAESLQDVLFKQYIRTSSLIDQAKFECKPIHYYKPKSDIAKDYEAVVAEILLRTKKGRD